MSRRRYSGMTSAGYLELILYRDAFNEREEDEQDDEDEDETSKI